MEATKSMEDSTNWLPDLELFESYGGDWNAYCEAIYALFKADFIDSSPFFQGQKLGLKRHPVIAGKEATFWHMISEGDKEEDRIPDFRRCERIRWPRPIIENHSNPALKVWTEKRKGEERIHIWLEHDGYLVVLNKRKGYILPWTAFHIAREKQKAKYLKRWERYREK
jgi:hypothetical protein